MPDLQNITLIIINFLIPFLLGSLIFFSVIIAPTTFTSLDQTNARRFIRSVFPKLYLWAHILSLITGVLISFYELIFGFITLLVSLGFLFSRQYLVKWINTVSDIKERNKTQKKKFELLHTISVAIFISQIICLAFIYIKI